MIGQSSRLRGRFIDAHVLPAIIIVHEVERDRVPEILYFLAEGVR